MKIKLLSFLLSLLFTSCFASTFQKLSHLDGLNNRVIEAVTAGSVYRLNSFLISGADPNVRDRYGNTALHLATRYGHTDCLKTLLQAGAFVNATDRNGRTALHFAARGSSGDYIDFLIEDGECAKDWIQSGADLSAPDKFLDNKVSWSSINKSFY